MKINLTTKKQDPGVLIVPVFEESKKVGIEDQVVNQFLSDNPKFGKAYETQFLYGQKEKILLVGLGKAEKFNFEICQNWAGSAVKTMLVQAKEISFLLPDVKNLPLESIVYAMGLGIEIAFHDPSLVYKSEKTPVKLKSIQILIDRAQKSYQDSLERSQIVAEGINLARMLGDMPGNEMTPTYFLTQAKKIAREQKLKITIIDEKKAKSMGMGGFVGVSKGSDEPSFIIALEYTGEPRSKEKWGLVGKGLTFDSGGISIKPDNSMQEMKYDMSGAAAVLGAMMVISKLKLKVNVAGVMILTENMPSGKALKPGDIVKTYSGKTAEIFSTDAEGRLILVDGLTLAQKDLKATRIVDLATLTGAMIVALGDFYTGVFANDDKFAQDLIMAGNMVGEKYWQMPMDGQFDEMVKSDIADLANIGHGGSMPGAAGSITAAKFLQAVIKKNIKWVHLDIAGTATDSKPKTFRGPGATGVGIKTLIELIARGK